MIQYRQSRIYHIVIGREINLRHDMQATIQVANKMFASPLVALSLQRLV